MKLFVIETTQDFLSDKILQTKFIMNASQIATFWEKFSFGFCLLAKILKIGWEKKFLFLAKK